MATQSETIVTQIPNLDHFPEPKTAAIVCSGRSGSKLLQSYLDSHDSLLMIPGYPLMYLYPHWDGWVDEARDDLSWDRIIDLFCDKHGSVLDSRRVPGLSGLERLGESADEHVQVHEDDFRSYLHTMLEGRPVSRKDFVLAVHYAYGLCKGWDLCSRPVLIFHIHMMPFLKQFIQDFPHTKTVHMTRNPRSSLHSTFRGLGVGDREKLNRTDAYINSGRNYWLSLGLQFESLDDSAGFLDRANIVSVKLESLHQERESTLSRLASWLGVNYSDSMADSTFDSKLWWGDDFSEATAPVNGLDPHAMQEKWRTSFNKTDSYVIEGILFHLFNEYRYPLTSYINDGPLNRMILRLAILLPSRAEKRVLGSYLNPVNHVKFIKAAVLESTGRLPRKDYTWNASHRYKYSYEDLGLWRGRWQDRFLYFTGNLRKEHGWGGLAGPATVLSCALYVAAQYSRFWLAAITYPGQVIKRWRICFGALRRRVSGNNFLPPSLR